MTLWLCHIVVMVEDIVIATTTLLYKYITCFIHELIKTNSSFGLASFKISQFARPLVSCCDICSVTCFDSQFWCSTRPMTSFCILIAYINTEGILFNVKITRWDENRSLNWINSMQVKKICFTNVFFSWSLCLLNRFPSMVFPKHCYLSGLLTSSSSQFMTVSGM
jgi:hypothetical protein